MYVADTVIVLFTTLAKVLKRFKCFIILKSTLRSIRAGHPVAHTYNPSSSEG
jgi:hypothetical protein